MIAGTPALRFSTSVISRASARRSPPSIRSTRIWGSTRVVMKWKRPNSNKLVRCAREPDVVSFRARAPPAQSCPGEVLEGAVEAPSKGLTLAWCRRRRYAERRVGGAARFAAEVLHERVRSGLVIGLGGVAQLAGLHPHVLGRRLELAPLLPDLFLRGGLALERARREQ